MDRRTATEQILEAKRTKGLTFQEIADKVGRHIVWTTSALMGQATMSAEEAGIATDLLGLGPEIAASLQEYPTKGSLDGPSRSTR